MLETYALWSEITEPGDSIAGLVRRVIGPTESLELIRSSITAKDLISRLPEDFFQPVDLLQTLDDSLECWRRRLESAKPEKSLERISKLGGSLLTPESADWPIALNDLADHAPAALWVIGKTEALSQTAISIIGARLASEYGLRLTGEITRYCVGQGWVIISGGALGIDAKASQSAIEQSGTTVCVMAGGLEKLYPSANLELFKQVSEAGALIAELPPGASPTRWRFLQRNRLIAALGKATVVVEAGFRSGSINTAGHANELGRPVGAIPGPVDSVRSAGCHRLIREQRAELIATPSQLAELMGVGTLTPEQIETRSTNQTRVLDAMFGGRLTKPQIASSAGLTLSQTEQTLFELRRLNLVIEISNRWQKL